MRIAQVNEVAYVASTLSRGLEARGHTVRMIDLPKPAAQLRYPWKLAALPLRLAILVMVGLRLRRMPLDIVHVHYASQGIAGLLSGHRRVVHCHGSDIRGATPHSAWGVGLAPVLRGADVVLYSTPDLAAAVRRFRPDAVFLPNPIDIERFAPGPAPTRDVLVGVRMDPVKGADVAVAAVRALAARHAGLAITVISDGPDAARLLRDLHPQIRVIPPVRHDEMPDLLRDHRVAVGQFMVGAMGMYELEAMACGTPVVMDFRYDDAYSEPVPVLQASTAAEAASAIAAILDDSDALAERRAQVRAWVVRHHGIGPIVDRLLALYASARQGDA